MKERSTYEFHENVAHVINSFYQTSVVYPLATLTYVLVGWLGAVLIVKPLL